MPSLSEMKKSSLEEFRSHRKLILVLGHVIFPAILAICIALKSDLGDFVFWAFVSAIILIQALLFMFSYRNPTSVQEAVSVAEEISDHLDLERKKCNFLKNDSSYKAAHITLLRFWSRLHKIYREKEIENHDLLIKIIQEILSPLIDSFGSNLFHFKFSERWSIVVYLWDEDSERLRPVWRKRAPNHPADNENTREWERGMGHTGRAFADREPKITDNILEEGRYEDTKPPDWQVRDYDREVYISIAAVPIAPLEHLKNPDAPEPLGVLVMTSDHKSRFCSKNCDVLKDAALLLHSIFHICGTDERKLVALAHPEPRRA